MDFENAKRSWKHRGKDFTIELVNWRHDVGDEEKWNIYAYVYPTHKWYIDNISTVKNETWWFDHNATPPMHGGITHIRIHEGSIQIECDYSHDGDDFYSTEIDPYTFEHDVNRLIKWLDNYNSNGQDIAEPIPAPVNKDGHGFSLEDLYQSTSEVC